MHYIKRKTERERLVFSSLSSLVSAGGHGHAHAEGIKKQHPFPGFWQPQGPIAACALSSISAGTSTLRHNTKPARATMSLD